MKILFILLALCSYSLIIAQGVGIGTVSPAPSAALDIVDTDGGLLIPRTDTSNIISPATGLLIYQNSNNRFYYFNGNQWSSIGEANSTVNKITDLDEDTRIHVEENSDEDRIRIYIKGDEVLQMQGKRIEFMNNGESLFLGQFAGASDDLSTNRNTFVGYRAGKSNVNGENNVAIGNQALDKTTDGNNNIAIGKQSMFQNTGSNNIGIGLNASQKNTAGTKNIAIGNNANFNNATGNENLAIGDEAGRGIASSNISNNIFIGNRSGISTQGSDNLAIGRDALSFGSNEGVRNIAIGDSSLFDVGSTSDNIAIGYKAGKNLEASQNTIVGSFAGESTTGDRNSFFGYRSGNKASGLNNSFFGHSTGEQNTSGKFNSYFGAFSGQANQVENNNSFFGHETGMDNLSCCNSFFGSKAGSKNTEGTANTFIGSEAGQENLTGENNVYVGNAAGKLSNSTNSTAVGVQAGYENIGENNSFIGHHSGEANTEGSNNTYLGYYSGLSNTSGSDNTQIGHMAGLDNTGNDNLFIGSEAGRWNKMGTGTIAIGNKSAFRDLETTNSVYLGYEAGLLNATANRTGNVFIGYKAGYNQNINDRLIIENSDSNLPLIYGKFDENSLSVNGNLGLGTYTPVTRLTIRGGNDPVTGPVASFEPSISDQSECGRLRFLESAGEDNWKGGFIRMDGLNNKFHIGIHNQDNGFIADDINILTIARSNGNLGIGEENPSEKLHVTGNIIATGSITSISDIRYKKNLSFISNPLDKLKKINGYYYDWRIEEYPDKEFSDKRQLGLIAQEVEAIFPEMVLTGSNGYKSIDYARLTPVLLEAIKSLHSKIKNQEKTINNQSASLLEINTRIKMIEQSLTNSGD